VVFGWIRERSNSIAPAIVAHVAHNVLMVAYAHATAGWGARLPAWGNP
jgi:membrane protease YdiL (CAAX protease family)